MLTENNKEKVHSALY